MVDDVCMNVSGDSRYFGVRLRSTIPVTLVFMVDDSFQESSTLREAVV